MLLNGLWWLAIVGACVQVVFLGYSLQAEHRRGLAEQERVRQEQQQIESIADALTPAQKSILLFSYTCSSLKPSNVKNAIMQDQMQPLFSQPQEAKSLLTVYSTERLLELGLVKEAKYVTRTVDVTDKTTSETKKVKEFGVGCSITPLGLKVGKYLYAKYPALALKVTETAKESTKTQ